MFSDPLPKIFCLCKFMCISFFAIHLDPSLEYEKKEPPFSSCPAPLFLYRMLALTRDMRCHFRAA